MNQPRILFLRCGNCGEERYRIEPAALFAWYAEHVRDKHGGTVHHPTVYIMTPEP